MTDIAHDRRLHRIAVATCCCALLPITIGAVVTTMKWGMAVTGWPGSDGYGMFTYPWFTVALDKFTEHGHRLAGVLIGMFAIVLAGWAWRSRPGRPVAWLALAVLAGVIVQGLLGGQRVLGNDPRFAMIHGLFGSAVFALMGVVVLVTARGWTAPARQPSRPVSPGLLLLAVSLPLLLVVQAVLGGLVRHLGGALFEHLGFAAVVTFVTAGTAMAALRTGESWLVGASRWLLVLLAVQVLLGAAAWVTRFGLAVASIGYVAVQNSAGQVVFRTAHAVTGMLLMLVAVNLSVRVMRLDRLSRRAAGLPTGPAIAVPGGPA